MNLRPSPCSSWIVRIWSSCAEPVPPIFLPAGFSFTAAMYSLAVLYGVSAFTQRMNWSSAIRAIGVRSRQLNGMPVWSGVVNRFESVMMIVWASPFLPLTSMNPSAPAPPDLFTTMIGRGESLCFSAMPEIRRAIWSAPPPVPAGTTNSIGFVGSQAAPAGAAARTRTRARAVLSSMCQLLSACAPQFSRCNWLSTENGTGRTPPGPGPGSTRRRTERSSGRLLDFERRLGRVQTAERHDGRNLPLLPHLVDLLLEVLQVLLDEVGEAALLQEVLAHGLARPPLDDRLGLAVVLHLAVLDLVERENARLDRQLAELVREHRVVVPALRARVERVDEGRAADRERAAHLVHHLHGVGGADGGHVAALGMPRRHHAGHVLLPARVDEPLGFAGGAEGGVGTEGGHARELDVGVGIRLVVVEQDEGVVLLVRQRRRDRAHAHVGSAAVAAERDHVDRLRLHLALAHERLEARRRAQRGRARRAELRVHPRHDPWRRVVRRVRDVHAAGRAQHDRARTRGLHHELHDQGGLAPLAGPVAGGEVLLERDLLDAPERLQDLGGVGERRALSHGRPLLFANTEPVRLRVGLPGLRRTVAHLGGLVDVFERDLSAAQAADEREQRRPPLGVVQRRPDLIGDHARPERRDDRVVAVDDADRLRLRQRLDEPLPREGPEPTQPHQPDLLALRPHLTDGDLDRERDRAHADQDDLGVLGHILLEPRILGPAAKDPAEVGVRLLDHAYRAPHRLIVLAT